MEYNFYDHTGLLIASTKTIGNAYLFGRKQDSGSDITIQEVDKINGEYTTIKLPQFIEAFRKGLKDFRSYPLD